MKWQATSAEYARLYSFAGSGLRPYALIVSSCFVYRFLFFPDMFLYEDDWYFYAAYVNLDESLLNFFVGRFQDFLQGRPLFFSGTFLLAKVAQSHLWIAYLLAFGLASFNYCLLFSILRHMFGLGVALFATLLYIVQPWDTTQAYFTHIMSVQLALSFSLIGVFLVRRSWVVSGGVSFLLSLFCYEGPFFIAIGLLALSYFQGEFAPGHRRLVLGGVVWLLALLTYAGMRIGWSESRAAEASLDAGFLATIFSRLGRLVGNMYSIVPFSFFEVAGTIYGSVIAMGAAFGIVVVTGLMVIVRRSSFNGGTEPFSQSGWGWSLRFIAILLCFAVASFFPFTLTTELYPALAGRGGRYYVGAALWIALGVAIILVPPEQSSRAGYWLRAAGTYVLVVYLGSYAFLVQRQYVELGEFAISVNYKAFSRVDDLNPDRDILIFAEDYLVDMGQMAMNRHHWLLDRLHSLLFQVSAGSALSLAVGPNSDSLRLENDLVRPNEGVPLASLLSSARLRAGKIIVLSIKGDEVRRLDSLIVDGREVAAPLPTGGVGRAAEVLPLTRFGQWFFRKATQFRESYPR